MTWTIEFDARASKDLRKLDKQAQKDILQYLRKRIAINEDPRRFGKQLSGKLSKLWRYRIGDYRVVCSIQDKLMVVLVLEVGHRKNIDNKK